MRIVFDKLTLKNFMSYHDETTIDLNRNGYILVNGINQNPEDNAKSNGTGKSSLFSAISWCLTGQTISGGKDITNIYFDEKAYVKLHLIIDGVPYVIERTKNPSNLKIYINGVNKSGKGIRDTEKLLNEYLPDITHSLVNSVIILGQGLPGRFTRNTPSGRKEVLEKLSNSDFMISDLKSRVSAREDYLRNKSFEIEKLLVHYTTKLDSVQEQLNNARNTLLSYNKEEYEKRNAEIEKLKADVLQITETESLIANSVASIGEEVETLAAELSNKHDKYLIDRNNLPVEDTSSLEEQHKNAQIRIKHLRTEIGKMESVKDVCPTCGQKLQGVVKLDTSELRMELDTVLNEDKLCAIELDRARTANKLLVSNFDTTYTNSIKDLSNTWSAKQSELNSKIAELSDTQKIKSTATMNIELAERSLETFYEEANRINENIAELEQSIEQIDKNILYYTNEQSVVESRLTIIAKMQSLLRRDFRGYLLINVIEYISSRTKVYATELFNTNKVDFILDGNNIRITYDNRDYEVLSGGEKQKLDVIVQLAIRDMLCQYLNFSSNILVLDEITDNLDTVGSQKMFNLISKHLNDVEAVYIVSHHTDFEIPVDGEITIVKGADKVSRII